MSKINNTAMTFKRHKGFSLLELLVAIVVLSILLTLALPVYSEFVQQSRRADAKHLLMLNAQRLQRCFTLEGIYNGSCVLRPGSEEGYYTLTSDLNATTFSLSAVPVAGTSQAADETCHTLTYDHTGWRNATGTDAARCW